MHIQQIKRNGPRFWPNFTRLAMFALLLEVLLLFCTPHQARADADALINVSTIRATASNSYAASRTYAGAVVAGRASELGFKYAGELLNIQADIGDQVQQGDLLASLNNASLRATLAQARAQVRVARANIAALEAEALLARQTEQRFGSLREDGHVSAQQYDEQRLTLDAKEAQQRVAVAGLAQAQAAQRAAEIAIAEAQIRAPFNGIVQARYADEGSQLTPGQPVLRLVEVENKEAHVGVPEQLAATMEPGATHQLRWAGQSFDARLVTVLPEVDPSNRTLTAVYRLPEEAGHVLPIGAVVELALTSEVNAAGFWVPLTALTESERGLWGVYVVSSEQRVERRLVEIVHTESARAFVRGTLQQDDQVVATGVQRLVPGQKVTQVLSKRG